MEGHGDYWTESGQWANSVKRIWLWDIFLKPDSDQTRKHSKVNLHFQVLSLPGQERGPSKCHLYRIVTI